MRKGYRELWFKMSKGDIPEYNTLKGIDVFEFWALYDLWLSNLKKETQKNKIPTNVRKQRL